MRGSSWTRPGFRSRKLRPEGGKARRLDRARRSGPASPSSATSRRSASSGTRCIGSPRDAGPWETFWILFYGFATYGNAGWMREQVCTYMCPYARFQSAMFDKDTLIITYDQARGEPRGKGRQGQGRGPGRLRRLQHLRAGLPDRHRHPRRAAVPVHRLRRLHRRLRPGDGQGRHAARPDPLFHHARGGAGSRARKCSGVRCGRGCSSTPRSCARHRACRVRGLYLRVPLKVDVIRDRAAIAREVEGGADRERLPPADHEHHRGRRASSTSRSPGLPTLQLATEPTRARRRRPKAAWCRCALRVDAGPGRAGHPQDPFQRARASTTRASRCEEKSVFIVR